MDKPIYKVLMFLKRRPGMSVAAFRDHYENVHVKLGEKHSGAALRYFRRFIEPVGGEELPFDVITELWVDNKEFFDGVCKMLVANDPPPEILEDEERLFDRSKSRVSTVIEYESDLEAVRKAASP